MCLPVATFTSLQRKTPVAKRRIAPSTVAPPLARPAVALSPSEASTPEGVGCRRRLHRRAQRPPVYDPDAAYEPGAARLPLPHALTVVARWGSSLPYGPQPTRQPTARFGIDRSDTGDASLVGVVSKSPRGLPGPRHACADGIRVGLARNPC